ncbi:MAG: tetratricopeptide repeat protein [Waterburya sp.]
MDKPNKTSPKSQPIIDRFFKEGKLKLEVDSNYSGAIADFNQSLQLNPNNANTYLMRGKAYFHLGEIQKAPTDFQKAIELCQQQGKIEVCREAQNFIEQVKNLK